MLQKIRMFLIHTSPRVGVKETVYYCINSPLNSIQFLYFTLIDSGTDVKYNIVYLNQVLKPIGKGC